MKLLLQAGIHLIKKVITFVIYGRSVQVFKACTLFYFFPAEFFFSQIFLRGKVLSHRFHRYTQIFFIMIFLHRISRMNRKAFLLAGLLTDFRRTLAAGQWLAPYICSCCFLSRRFRRWRRFFFVGGFCPTDFTDIHRFFMESLLNLFVQSQGGICNDRTGRLRENPWVIVSAGNLRINSVKSDE